MAENQFARHCVLVDFFAIVLQPKLITIPMNSLIECAVSERYSEYLHLSATNDLEGALENLVQVYHCLPMLEEASRTVWLEKLNAIPFSKAAVLTLEVYVNEEIERIKKYLTIGSYWNADEVLLILQQRIFIDLFREYYKGITGNEMDVSLQQIDQLITNTARDADNRQSFRVAIRLLNRNWGLPIRSKWLMITP